MYVRGASTNSQVADKRAMRRPIAIAAAKWQRTFGLCQFGFLSPKNSPSPPIFHCDGNKGAAEIEANFPKIHFSIKSFAWHAPHDGNDNDNDGDADDDVTLFSNKLKYFFCCKIARKSARAREEEN